MILKEVVCSFHHYIGGIQRACLELLVSRQFLRFVLVSLRGGATIPNVRNCLAFGAPWWPCGGVSQAKDFSSPRSVGCSMSFFKMTLKQKGLNGYKPDVQVLAGCRFCFRTSLDCALDPGVQPFEDPSALLKVGNVKTKDKRFDRFNSVPTCQCKAGPLSKHFQAVFVLQIALPTAALVAPGAAATQSFELGRVGPLKTVFADSCAKMKPRCGKVSLLIRFG